MLNIISDYHEELIVDVLREACATTADPSFRQGVLKAMTALLPLPRLEDYLMKATDRFSDDYVALYDSTTSSMLP